ncbi:hypothetical protein EJB05_30089, partial [Eragrostis curvula]
MAAGGGGLLWLWTEWGTQILVLVSMFLQVVLLIFGGMRRRGLSAWQNVVLWLAYQLADSTAIFTLGHLSITSKPREHGRLAAFWAPFLLLHLGGPHNITAYALEDNRLWLRHLQTLGVQALGAAYVLYRFYHAGSGSGGTLLTLASASMFVAGLAKYGERTWALRCANKTCRSSDRIEEDNVVNLEVLDYRRSGSTDSDMHNEKIVLFQAHTYLPICRRFLFDNANVKGVFNSSRGVPVREEDTLKLVEMELSLLYDTLYTKAPVIHTWYGFCIHFISMVGTSAALCLFHLSRGTNNNQGQGYSRVDVVISYVLLAGALVLEIISACRAVLSTWTCTLLLSMGWGYSWRHPRVSSCLRWLRYQVLHPLRKYLKLATMRLWHRGTMGQYNLLYLATRDRTDLGSRLAAKLGLEDSWDKLHFSGTFAGTQSLSMEQLKGLLKGVLWRNRFAYHADTRGRFTLEQNGAFDSFAQWAVKDAMFDESIVIWHIATNIFIWEYSTAHNYNIELVEATRVLSNYMMFLLVAKPNMLPGRERRYVHLNVSRELKEFLQDDHVRASSGSWWNNCCILKKLFHHEGLDCFSGISEELAEALRPGLATQLLDLELDRLKTLEVIFEVWVEMMLYAAENCPRDSHARELGNGGELMTIVWLLVKHYNQAARNNGSNSPAESGGEVGRKLVHFDGPLELTGGNSTYRMVYKATLEDGSLVAPSQKARAPNTPVDWATRMIIAKGTARGLAYLHDDMSIIHGNLTARNVLLDEQNNPKISHFGLSRLMTATANSNVLALAGAQGYHAPELKKLLMRDAAAGNVGDELMDTLKLALHCVDPSPSVRPDAREVLRQLEQIRPGNEGGAGPSEEGHVPLSAGGGDE